MGSDLAGFLLDRLDEEPLSEGRRRIVAHWGAYADAAEDTDEGVYATAFLDAMRMLVVDFAGHPDCRPEWLPPDVSAR